MNELRGACIIGQSGGPTAVINASAYGVIKARRAEYLVADFGLNAEMHGACLTNM